MAHEQSTLHSRAWLEYSAQQSRVKPRLRFSSAGGTMARSSIKAPVTRRAAPLTSKAICPIVRALGGGATDGGTCGLAVLLGRRALDLRQRAPQGRALPRYRRRHRVVCAGPA